MTDSTTGDLEQVDWKSWALDMCSLLDRIEAVTDEQEVHDLCQGRFDMARDHGLDVQLLGKTSGVDQ